MLNAVMSVLDGFENTKRVVEEKLCEKLVFEGIEIDISRRLIYRGKSEIKTTFVEFEILHLLARNPGKVFSKEQIYELVWEEHYFGDYNIVMSHIRNIREKIEDNPSKPIYIHVETVCLLSKLHEAKHHVNVTLYLIIQYLLLLFRCSIAFTNNRIYVFCSCCIKHFL